MDLNSHYIASHKYENSSRWEAFSVTDDNTSEDPVVYWQNLENILYTCAINLWSEVQFNKGLVQSLEWSKPQENLGWW